MIRGSFPSPSAPIYSPTLNGFPIGRFVNPTTRARPPSFRLKRVYLRHAIWIYYSTPISPPNGSLPIDNFNEWRLKFGPRLVEILPISNDYRRYTEKRDKELSRSGSSVTLTTVQFNQRFEGSIDSVYGTRLSYAAFLLNV